VSTWVPALGFKYGRRVHHRGYKIHYIGLSAGNFVTKHNPKSFSVVEFEQDKKLHALTQGLAKIRDKHGVDMIGVGREMG